MSDHGDKSGHSRDLEFLAEVSRETLSSLQVGHVLWNLVKLLRNRFGYEYAAAGLVEGDSIVFHAGSGLGLESPFHEPPREAQWVVPIGSGVVGKVAGSGEARLVGQTAIDPDYAPIDALGEVRSQLCVPFHHGGEVTGVIDVRSARVEAFSEPDLQLLRLVSSLVAPAVHTAQMFERERRRVRHLHLVNAISRLVMSSLDRERVVSTSCEAMLETLDVSFVAIALLDQTSGRVVQGGYATRCEFVEGLDFEHWSAQLGEGVVSEVIRTGRIIRLGDVRSSPAYREVVRGVRSHLSVPLQIMGETIGALVVEHIDTDRFNEDDEELLENLAGYLAQAIDNARLFGSQRRRWQQLLLINEVARIATKTIELDQILHLVAREVHERFGYFAAAIWLCEDGHVVVRALASESELDLSIGHKEPTGEGMAGIVAETERTFLADEPDEFQGSVPLVDGARSALCVPLVAGDRTIGVVEVQSRRQGAFTSDDRLVMETLAKSVAGAISNARAIGQTEQLREDLNRMIVHDLRNPVQAVQLTLQEVTARETLSEQVTESVREGISCTEDILEMINSLLDVARFEAGRARLRIVPGVLNDHIRAVVRRFAPLARSKAIQVTSVLSQDVPVMRFDHELIERMLANLVGNALKFTPSGAKVNIRSELIDAAREDLPLSEPCVRVSIGDTGEGIPSEYHDKIFEKFGQVESRKAGLRMSTGLGLTLCRYVVEGHRGRIWVESALGEGSTFHIALPVPEKKR